MRFPYDELFLKLLTFALEAFVIYQLYLNFLR